MYRTLPFGYSILYDAVSGASPNLSTDALAGRSSFVRKASGIWPCEMGVPRGISNRGSSNNAQPINTAPKMAKIRFAHVFRIETRFDGGMPTSGRNVDDHPVRGPTDRNGPQCVIVANG